MNLFELGNEAVLFPFNCDTLWKMDYTNGIFLAERTVPYIILFHYLVGHIVNLELKFKKPHELHIADGQMSFLS